MGPELLEIQPRELSFTFEAKKKSSCWVQLVNKSREYVAFKIKTTSPKRYSVQPNTGVILPRSKRAFVVTMQAQRSAPPDMQLKDKFLVQSTIVSYGCADEDVLPSFFSKDSGRYIEENKLRVILVTPSHSPLLQPTNGALKHEQANEAPFLKDTTALKEIPGLQENPALKETPASKEAPDLKQTTVSKDQAPCEAENLAPSQVKDVEDLRLKITNLESKLNEVKDVEDLRLKITNLESKLNEANKVIATLKSSVDQEKDKLQQEIFLLRRKSAARVQVGFPFLFVVFMTLVGITIGYLSNQ